MIIWVLIISLNIISVYSRQLILLNTITRHGERSPCFTYPNDPFKSAWTRGLGQLTDVGINQLKEVGYFLRNEYANLIPKEFHKKRVRVRSSDTDRTIMSALSLLQALFPGQVVPVHTVPKPIDYQLKMTSHCPHHADLLAEEYRNPRHATTIAEFKPLFGLLQTETGLAPVDIALALRICDAVTVWHRLSDRLSSPRPEWAADPSTVDACVRLGHLKFVLAYSSRSLTRFRGGPLVETILDKMLRRAELLLANKAGGMAMYSYFTHDSTMSAFLGHLKAFNNLKPPLASTILVELYHDPLSATVSSGLADFTVVLRHRNRTDRSPVRLYLCGLVGSECRLDVLTRQMGPTFMRADLLVSACGIEPSATFSLLAAAAGIAAISSTTISPALPDSVHDSSVLSCLGWYLPLLTGQSLLLLICWGIFYRRR